MLEDLEKRILAALPKAEVYFRDLTGQQNHFEAYVVSDLFDGKSRIERSRMVMDSVAELFAGPLHALTIKTLTPSEWAKQQESL